MWQVYDACDMLHQQWVNVVKGETIWIEGYLKHPNWVWRQVSMSMLEMSLTQWRFKPEKCLCFVGSKCPVLTRGVFLVFHIFWVSGQSIPYICWAITPFWANFWVWVKPNPFSILIIQYLCCFHYHSHELNIIFHGIIIILCKRGIVFRFSLSIQL